MDKTFFKRRINLIFYVINVLFLLSDVSLMDTVVLSGTNKDVYSMPGDLNIGVIMMLTYGTNESGCSKRNYPHSWNIEYPEAVAFAVDKVNQDGELLPNIKLGFFLLDDCSDRRFALAQALTFLPRHQSTAINDSCNETSHESPYPLLSDTFVETPIPHYDVMGILAPMLSISAVPVSFLMSAAKMPIVGYTTTSDELSDSDLHPYYLRVVTPDKYQAIAMLKFISSNGWTYISIVYSAGAYGERAFETLKTYAPNYNICIATSDRVNNDDDTDPIALDLVKYLTARVVILFADEEPVRSLFTSVAKLNRTGHFIWVCCDSVTTASTEKLREHRHSIVGAFLFMYNTVIVPGFYDYLRRQNVSLTSNPWFKQSWESTAGCRFAKGSCDPNDDITEMANFGRMLGPSLAIDAVLTFAHGAHDLITQLCANVSGVGAKQCVKRDLLRDHLLNVSFQGYTGMINFDKEKGFRGTYLISQMAYDCVNGSKNRTSNTSCVEDLVKKTIAHYNSSTDSLVATNESISWDHLKQIDRIVPLEESAPNLNIPESVCSRPCLNDEYQIKKELDCCWDCRKCRDNEKLVHGDIGCQECEIFTWPDPETDFTTCSLIPLTHPLPSDTLPVILVFLAVVAITATCIVIGSYIYYYETRVIKAASRELSFLQLGGVFVGYITVICFQTTPTPRMCSALYFMFCLSFAWLYSPLLVKSIRIYRIFQSGSKSNQRPRFISPMSQVLFSSAVIISQIILCLVMYIIYQPTSKMTQAVPTENLVELSCDMTLPGLASFLAYNLILVSACATFAFKTRKLPDNFNESRFITMCVYTTLIIWLAFIPTYFTASRELLRGLLLSIALLLNHTVAVLFLFLPKIYAIIYVDQESLILNRYNTGNTSHIPSGSSNRVGVATTVRGADPRQGY